MHADCPPHLHADCPPHLQADCPPHLHGACMLIALPACMQVRLLVVGATNRPQELDDAARRRLQKRLLIPLPDRSARLQMLQRGLRGVEGGHGLSEEDFESIVGQTDGYSGSDMAGLCREAAMEPLRDEGFYDALRGGGAAADAAARQVRPVCRDDFRAALCQVRPSVSQRELEGFEAWNLQYGSFANQASMRERSKPDAGARAATVS